MTTRSQTVRTSVPDGTSSTGTGTSGPVTSSDPSPTLVQEVESMGHRAMIGMVVLVVALSLVIYTVVKNASDSKPSKSSPVWNPETGKWVPVESEEKKQGRMMSTLLLALSLVVFLGSVMVSEGLIHIPLARTLAMRLSVVSYFAVIATAVSATLTGVGAFVGIAWIVVAMGGVYMLYPILKTHDSSQARSVEIIGGLMNLNNIGQKAQQVEQGIQTDQPPQTSEMATQADSKKME